MEILHCKAQGVTFRRAKRGRSQNSPLAEKNPSFVKGRETTCTQVGQSAILNEFLINRESSFMR